MSVHDPQAWAGVLEAIFDSVADGVAMYDAQGHIVRVNAALLRILGLKPDINVAGMTVEDAAARLDVRDTQGMPLRIESLPQLRALAGEALLGPQTQDVAIHTLDGRDVVLNVSATPVLDQRGVRIGAVSVARDVTERYRQDERSRMMLQGLVTMAEAIVMPGDISVERGGQPVPRQVAERALQVLGCERLIIFAASSPSTPVHTFQVAGLSPEDERRYWAAFASHASLESVFGRKAAHHLLTDEPLVLDWSQEPQIYAAHIFGITSFLVVPLFVGQRFTGALCMDYAGRPHAYDAGDLALAHAVGRLVAMEVDHQRLLRESEASREREERLRVENQRMDDFLSYASHEMRDPLTSLSLRVQQATKSLERAIQLSGDGTAETVNVSVLRDVRDLLRRTGRQFDLLEELTGELLDVSRIQMDKLHLRLEWINLADVLREAVEQQRQVTPGRQITLALDTQHATGLLDRQRISQVIRNLLTNAVKYSPANTPIVARLHVRRDLVYVEIEDQGPGLTEEQQQLIWEPFAQIPDILARERTGAGLGLGLYISKMLIARHHGQISVSSVPGYGSIFWFALRLITREGE
jgi:PAS domain S-box-containing protein